MSFANAPEIARRFMKDLASAASRLEEEWDQLDEMTKIESLARIESLSHTAGQLQVIAASMVQV